MRADLVTAGESFDDLIFYDLPRLPRPGEELKTSRFSRVPGGGAIITAVAAARLGVRTAVLSGASDATRDRLRTEAIRLQNLRRPGEPPALTVALSTGRDRSFVTFNGVNALLERRLLATLKTIRARHIHCAFYPSRCKRWVTAVRALQHRGMTVSWDFGWNPGLNDDPAFAQLLARLDVVFVNADEARLYSGVPSMPAAFTWWRRTAGVTIVKLGKRGAVYLSERTVIRAPAPAVRAVDTTGAGDAFNGGYLAALIAGAGAGDCLRLGNDVGARSTTRAGGLDALPTVPPRARWWTAAS